MYFDLSTFGFWSPSKSKGLPWEATGHISSGFSWRGAQLAPNLKTPVAGFLAAMSPYARETHGRAEIHFFGSLCYHMVQLPML